jgi:hypothetical protein
MTEHEPDRAPLAGAPSFPGDVVPVSNRPPDVDSVREQG